MAEKIVFYGRVNGQVKFTYGPKQFNADWGGAFTALEIANLLTKLPKVNIGKRTPIIIRRVGSAAEKVNLQMWMERLELALISLDLDSLMINATKVNRMWVDKILPSQVIRFSGKNQSPSKRVGDALCKMGLNYWGVVQELTVAMSEFDSKTTTGNRSASAFFTI
jgi:hypothetical protein